MCSKKSNKFDETFVSSSSLSPSSASCSRVSHTWSHHLSCFALTQRRWSMTLTLSKTFVFPQSSHRKSSPLNVTHWKCPSLMSLLLCSLHRFLSLSRRSCTASVPRLVDPLAVPLTFSATPQGLSWRLVRLSASWSRRGHLQSKQVSKVPDACGCWSPASLSNCWILSSQCA